MSLKTKSTFVVFLLATFAGYSFRPVQNFEYAVKDTARLTMDVYTPDRFENNTPCLIFVFGGGFFTGSKTEETNVTFCKAMADSGFVVAAIDYRLGMKGVKKRGLAIVPHLLRSVSMAVEDLYSATNYLIGHAGELNIDTSRIVISGSSAGAITALQADYELSNGMKRSKVLPSGFRYGGVISFAGGVLSHEWKPDYRKSPAPTLFFHGTGDKIVNYKKVQLLWLGLFGSDELSIRFKKCGYSYTMIRFSGIGHEICYLPMLDNRTEICSFIRKAVVERVPVSEDETFDGSSLPRVSYGDQNLQDLYK